MGTTGNLDTPAEALARRLKAARALSGKKVRELADELGWADEKLYRLERGVQVPDALELAAIAARTGVAFDFFFGTASPGNGASILSPVPARVNGNEAGSA